MMSLIVVYIILALPEIDILPENPQLQYNWSEVWYGVILVINVVLLAYAVFRIRLTIKSLSSAFPNESFVRIHLINSFIYTVLYLILGGFLLTYVNVRGD